MSLSPRTAVLLVALAGSSSPTLGIGVVDGRFFWQSSEDFSSFAVPEVRNDPFIIGAGAFTEATISGIFDGQTSTNNGGWEAVNGTPTVPLALVGQGPSQNVVLLRDNNYNTNVVAGLFDGGVRGALSVLFETDQELVGLDLLGTGDAFMDTDAEDVVFQFFARDGSLIDTETLSGGGTTNIDGTYVFSVDATDPLIAGFTITNNDPNGVVFGAFRWDGTAPEPSAAALVLLGGLLLYRRRRAGQH